MYITSLPSFSHGSFEKDSKVALKVTLLWWNVYILVIFLEWFRWASFFFKKKITTIPTIRTQPWYRLKLTKCINSTAGFQFVCIHLFDCLWIQPHNALFSTIFIVSPFALCRTLVLERWAFRNEHCHIFIHFASKIFNCKQEWIKCNRNLSVH